MVNNTQGYSVFGLCPSSGILKTRRFGNWICLRPRIWGWETRNLLDPLERANLNLWAVYVSITTAI
jgi:hypothetical protein